MNPAENYILNQPEPFKSILLQLQIIFESTIQNLDLKYKWKIPYYYLQEKPFCYLNVSKGYVDIGFRYGEYLSEYDNHFISEKRTSFKSLRYFSIDEIDAKILTKVLLAIKENGYNGYWN